MKFKKVHHGTFENQIKAAKPETAVVLIFFHITIRSYLCGFLSVRLKKFYVKFEKKFVFAIFEKVMIVQTLASEDQHFRDRTCKIIHELCRQIVGAISVTYFSISADFNN